MTEPRFARLACHSVVDPHTGCWLWQGHKSVKGYGLVSIRRKRRRVHRLAYALTHEPIPEGLVIDHLCRNRACWYPPHLETVTNRENILRGDGYAAVNARKTHCSEGHEYTPENTRQRVDKRQCRICLRAYKRRRRQQLKKSR